MLALAFSANASVLPWPLGLSPLGLSPLGLSSLGLSHVNLGVPAAVNIAESPLALRTVLVRPQQISLSQGIAAPQLISTVGQSVAVAATPQIISPLSARIAAPIAVASAPIAIAAAEGNYVAANRGSVHVAPLPGHLQSATSLNLEPAPGTL